jgi:hypothetical protein
VARDAIGQGQGFFGEAPVGAMVGDHPLAKVGKEARGQGEQGKDDEGHLDGRPCILGPINDRGEERQPDQKEVR